MGNASKATALVATIVGVLVLAPLAISAQENQPKKKTNSASTTTSTKGTTTTKGTTGTGGKGKTVGTEPLNLDPKAPYDKVTPSTPSGAEKHPGGVTGSTTRGATQLSPNVYKGPVPPPPSSPTPNDSAHKRPPH